MDSSRPARNASPETIDRLVAEGLLDRHWLARPADLSPLPIAGLMSDQPIEWVRDQMDELLRAGHQLG